MTRTTAAQEPPGPKLGLNPKPWDKRGDLPILARCLGGFYDEGLPDYYRLQVELAQRISAGEGSIGQMEAYYYLLLARMVSLGRMLAETEGMPGPNRLETVNRIESDYQRKLDGMEWMFQGEDPLSKVLRLIWDFERWQDVYLVDLGRLLPSLGRATSSGFRSKELWAFARRVVDQMDREQLAKATSGCRPKETRDIGRMKDRLLWHLRGKTSCRMPEGHQLHRRLR